MATTVATYPGTTGTAARTSATDWTNPGNIVSDNTTDATCNNTTGAGSYYLIARNFGFALSSLHTIRGITVVVQASEHTTGTEVLNAQLQDADGNLFGGSKTATISGTTKVNYTYGSTSDVWSATLTPAVINDPDFGVRVWFTTTHDVRIDFIRITVEYGEGIQPGAGATTLTGYAPALTFGTDRTIGAGAVTAAGYAPTIEVSSSDVRVSYARLSLGSGLAVTPGVGELTAAGYAPTLAQTANAFVTPGLGELVAAGPAPGVARTANQWITSGVGTVTASGYAPTRTVTGNLFVTTSVGALTAEGYAPSVSAASINVRVSYARLRTFSPIGITAGLGQLTATGNAPTVLVSANKWIAAGAGTLTAAGYAPTRTEFIRIGAGGLPVLGFSPSVARTQSYNITPGPGAITVTGYAPVQLGNYNISAGLGEVTAEGYAPARQVDRTITPGPGAVTVQGFAPFLVNGGADVRVSYVRMDTQNNVRLIGAGVLTVTGYAPALGAIILGGGGYRTITWTASSDPGVTGYWIYWDVSSRGDDAWQDYRYSAWVPGRTTESYTVSGLIPYQNYYFNLSADDGTHGVYESELVGEFFAEALDGSLIASGHAPVITQTRVVYKTPGVGSVTAEGYPPSLDTTVTLEPGALTAEGYAATVEQTANKWIDAGIGTLTAEGFAPALAESTINSPVPGTGALTAIGFAPTVEGKGAINLGLGELTAEGFAPGIILSDLEIIYVGTGEVTAEGFAPGVFVSAFAWADMDGPSILTLEGFAPDLTAAGAFSLEPGVGVLTVEGYTPEVDSGGKMKHAGGRRKRRYLYEERKKEEQDEEPPEETLSPKTPKKARRTGKAAPAPEVEPEAPQAAPEPDTTQRDKEREEDLIISAMIKKQEAEEMQAIMQILIEEDRMRREKIRQLLRDVEAMINPDDDEEALMLLMMAV